MPNLLSQLMNQVSSGRGDQSGVTNFLLATQLRKEEQKKRRIQQFGNDLLGHVESGAPMDAKTVYGLIRQHDISPEDATAALKFLKDSQAWDIALRERNKKISDIVGAEGGFQPGATVGEATTLGQGIGTGTLEKLVARPEAKKPKITKGAPYIDERGVRVVPFYDEQGDLVRKVELGKIKQEEKAPPVSDKNAPFTIAKELRSLTHDRDGVPRESVPTNDIVALDEKAKNYGMEIVRVRVPQIKNKGLFGIDMLSPDKNASVIYVLVKKGTSNDDLRRIVKEQLVSAYEYTPEEVNKIIQ